MSAFTWTAPCARPGSRPRGCPRPAARAPAPIRASRAGSRVGGSRRGCRGRRRSCRGPRRRAYRLDEVLGGLLQEVGAEDDGEPAQRGQRGLLVLAQLVAGRPHPERVELGAEPLGRAPGAAQDALRARLGRDEREHPLGHGLSAERVEARPRGGTRRPRPPRAARARGARTASRGGRSSRARVGAVRRIDLAGAEALLERLGREVDEHDLVGLVQDAVRERLADAHAGELGDLVVQALEVLHVHGRDDVDARREHLVDVLVALRRSAGRGRSCAPARRRARARARGGRRRRRPAPSSSTVPCSTRRRGTTSRPSASAAVSGRSCGSR